MDKIEQFIKKNKGCPMTPAATKQLLVKFMEFMGKELPGMIEEDGFKYGYYYHVHEDGHDKIKYGGEQGELIPEDYNGISYEFLDDGLYVAILSDDEETSSVWFNGQSIDLYNADNTSSCTITSDGINKLAFAGLTHSFNELDPTLKALVISAIADAGATGVACTQAQWKAIKTLLDKSLYISYEGCSMIKSYTNGISTYLFGAYGMSVAGCILEFSYADNDEELYAKFTEM